MLPLGGLPPSVAKSRPVVGMESAEPLHYFPAACRRWRTTRRWTSRRTSTRTLSSATVRPPSPSPRRPLSPAPLRFSSAPPAPPAPSWSHAASLCADRQCRAARRRVPVAAAAQGRARGPGGRGHRSPPARGPRRHAAPPSLVCTENLDRAREWTRGMTDDPRLEFSDKAGKACSCCGRTRTANTGSYDPGRKR